MLVQLSSHYWRPDYSPGQYRALLEDFIEDLAPFSLDEIRRAIDQYRADPTKKFFPHPGALIGLMRPPPSPTRRAISLFRASDYPDPEKPATRTAAEVLSMHGKK